MQTRIWVVTVVKYPAIKKYGWIAEELKNPRRWARELWNQY